MGSEVRGAGTVGSLTLGAASTLSPGPAEYAFGRLRVTGALVLGGDATSRFDMGDASGIAGAGSTRSRRPAPAAWSARPRRTPGAPSRSARPTARPARTRPALTRPLTSGGPCTRRPRARSTGSPRTFALDTSGFSNDLQGGSFSLDTSADGTSLDLVFTPACPNTHVWTGLSLFSDDWSDRFNWLGGVGASDGDSLAFIGLLRQHNVNDCLHSVGSVRLWNAGCSIEGDPLTMDGALRDDAGFSGNAWLIPTTAGADLTIKNDCGELDVGDLALHDGTTGHALTVDAAARRSLRGNVDGAGTGLHRDQARQRRAGAAGRGLVSAAP